ncbi:transglycosylase SLT domain-containing protein [Segatella salivae]|jgi:hypothetical protein|uniref:transglycosylase SLT domain-containing protein n=1 Tax=Segatella salivae TaxID=228604 RepID=UPI001CB03893|nr:transglycosylase SLT domain-containing protein [Segatella salivae]MBF1526738.1 lytic transglycosylase domain-containing protein [Segatella salivae]
MDKRKKIVLLIFSVFMFFPMYCCAAEQTENANEVDWNPVINAIIHVESKGNSRAKSGSSVGVLQITPVLVAECNQILKKRKSKKRFKLSDRFSIAKSKEMFLLIQSYHNPLNDIETAIRAWNGGIHFSIKKTQRYFEKVMSLLH